MKRQRGNPSRQMICAAVTSKAIRVCERNMGRDKARPLLIYANQQRLFFFVYCSVIFATSNLYPRPIFDVGGVTWGWLNFTPQAAYGVRD